MTAWVLLDQALRPVHAAAYLLVALGLTLSLAPARLSVPSTPE